MRALDLFSGWGGVTAGLLAAGFNVVGVDIERPKRFPDRATFVEGDVFTIGRDLLASGAFDVVLASPTCNDHSYLKHTYGREHGSAWQLTATREMVTASGLPYVIENVPGAPLVDPVTLCGTMFDLPRVFCADGVWRELHRHRNFESNVPLTVPGPCRHTVPSLGVYGGGPKVRAPRAIEGRAGYQGTMPERRAAMGIDWIPREPLNRAIPPAYAEHIGRQLRAHLER